ncbi:MAG: choice-of-anchor C family protein [Pseudomonadota bacterium]
MMSQPREKGFILVVILISFAAVATVVVGAAVFSTQIKKIANETRTHKRIIVIREAARKYYRGHFDVPGLPGAPGAGPVPVGDLNLGQAFTQDMWGRPLEYYRAATPPAGGAGLVQLDINGIQVNGAPAAGYVLSFGPDGVKDSVLSGGAINRTGDDVLEPIGLKAEAVAIVLDEILVLSKKVCSCFKRVDPLNWDTQCSPAAVGWDAFLASYGLGINYKGDSWDSLYVLENVSGNRRFYSKGPDRLDGGANNTDNIYGPTLNLATCPYISLPAANLLNNPDFEQGLSPGNFTTKGPGNPSFPGWTINSGNIDHINAYWQAASGQGSIDLDGNSPGTISQTFASIPGARYLLTFYLAGNPDAAPLIKRVQVSVTDATLPGPPPPFLSENFAYYVVGSTRTNMRWAQRFFSFTAQSASTTLTFHSLTVGACCWGPALDNIQLVYSNRVFVHGLNGSFEDGPVDNIGAFRTLSAGSTEITGWTVGGGGVDVIGSYWRSADGNRSLDMSAITPGSVSKTFNTTVGKTYRVSFDMAGNPACGTPLKTMLVEALGAGGLAVFSNTYTFSTTGHTTANMGWTPITFDFTADSAASTIRFTSQTAGACGPALDHVWVEELP